MGSSKKSKTEVIETEMSKEQAEILKKREEFYQEVTQPALKDYFNATRNFSLNNNFSTLDDLTNQLDGIFSQDPEQSQLSRDLFRRGFSGEDAEAAQLKQKATGAVAREGTTSQARLAALQQGNQNILAENQNILAGQNVRQGGIDALLSQAPGSTQAGQPLITQVQSDNSNAWMGALGGALGAGGASLFSGSGNSTIGSGAGFNQGFGGGSLAGTFNFSTGQLSGGAGGAGMGMFR